MSGALLSVAATKVVPLEYLALEAGGLCCCVSQVCNNQRVSSWTAPTQRASCKQRTEPPPPSCFFERGLFACSRASALGADVWVRAHLWAY